MSAPDDYSAGAPLPIVEAPEEAQPPSRRLRGYLELGTASTINGSIGTMVSYATMPASMLLVLRMAFAALALGVVVLPRRGLRDLRRPGVPIRVFGIGCALALNLLFYFLGIRGAGVAVAIFLSYLAPVYLAVVAPLVFHERTEPVVYLALAVGVGGMALILVPALAGDLDVSSAGLFFSWAAGVMYTVYLLFAKSLRTRRASSTAVVFVQSAFTAVVLLPLGLYEVVGRYTPTGTDLLMALLLGVLTTAVSFSLFMHGLRYVKVQHAPIMGYLEPVSAPIYAYLFLGEVPTVWTVAGGALIVAAGLLVVLFGEAEAATS